MDRRAIIAGIAATFPYSQSVVEKVYEIYEKKNIDLVSAESTKVKTIRLLQFCLETNIDVEYVIRLL